MKTKVIFYKERDTDDVFAFFPSNAKDDVRCYAHIGQHSACSDEYIKECEPITDQSVPELIEKRDDLLNELILIGYDVNIFWHSNYKR